MTSLPSYTPPEVYPSVRASMSMRFWLVSKVSVDRRVDFKTGTFIPVDERGHFRRMVVRFGVITLIPILR